MCMCTYPPPTNLNLTGQDKELKLTVYLVYFNLPLTEVYGLYSSLFPMPLMKTALLQYQNLPFTVVYKLVGIAATFLHEKFHTYSL